MTRPKSPIHPRVQQRIRELGLRNERGFALHFGFPSATLGHLLYGREVKGRGRVVYKPSIDLLPKLATALGLTVYEVLDLYLPPEDTL